MTLIELEVAGLGIAILTIMLKMNDTFTKAVIKMNEAIERISMTVELCPYCQEKRIKRKGDENI